jgi:hypothetical protein
MPTHTETLTDDITGSKAFVIVAPTDQEISDTAEMAVTNNQTATEQLLASLTVTDAYVDISVIDVIEDYAFTFASSFDYTVSLLLNKTLDSLEYVGEFFRIGKPIVFWERDDALPVIFSERGDALPIIFSDGEFGIERSIQMISRIRVSSDQSKEEHKKQIESTNELSIVDPTDQTEDKTATIGCSFNTSVA